MEWIYINTMEDVKYLEETYDNFLDSELVSFNFTSGNYVDDDLVGHEYMTNILNIVFQRLDRNPFSIELSFEEMRRLSIYTPLIIECSADIIYAKIVIANGFIYWTKWRDFNPYDEDHLRADTTYIESKRLKWRIIS